LLEAPPPAYPATDVPAVHATVTAAFAVPSGPDAAVIVAPFVDHPEVPDAPYVAKLVRFDSTDRPSPLPTLRARQAFAPIPDTIVEALVWTVRPVVAHEIDSHDGGTVNTPPLVASAVKLAEAMMDGPPGPSTPPGCHGLRPFTGNCTSGTTSLPALVLVSDVDATRVGAGPH
jgi:hypothetical protein